MALTPPEKQYIEESWWTPEWFSNRQCGRCRGYPGWAADDAILGGNRFILLSCTSCGSTLLFRAELVLANFKPPE